MILDIYASTKKTKDGQHFAVVTMDEPGISYLYIKSFGREPLDKMNAEITALEKVTALAARFSLTSHIVNIFHSFEEAVLKDGSVRPGNEHNDAERFYCALESMTLENILFIEKAGKEIVMVKIPEDKNLSLLTLTENDLGYYVDIDDMQITNEGLADDFLFAVQ